MTMTIDELVSQAAQLSPLDQDELVLRLIALRRKQSPHSVLPPGTHGSVWLANWEQVRIDPSDADEMIRVIGPPIPLTPSPPLSPPSALAD